MKGHDYLLGENARCRIVGCGWTAMVILAQVIISDLVLVIVRVCDSPVSLHAN